MANRPSAKPANKSFVINADRVSFWATSSIRTAAERNAVGNRLKPAASAADIFCRYGNGPKMKTGYRPLEMREGKHPLRARRMEGLSFMQRLVANQKATFGHGNSYLRAIPLPPRVRYSAE